MRCCDGFLPSLPSFKMDDKTVRTIARVCNLSFLFPGVNFRFESNPTRVSRVTVRIFRAHLERRTRSVGECTLALHASSSSSSLSSKPRRGCFLSRARRILQPPPPVRSSSHCSAADDENASPTGRRTKTKTSTQNDVDNYFSSSSTKHSLFSSSSSLSNNSSSSSSSSLSLSLSYARNSPQKSAAQVLYIHTIPTCGENEKIGENERSFPRAAQTRVK